MTLDDNINERTKKNITWFVLAVAIFSASWSASDKTLSNHECMVSITAREMLQNHNWIIPTCNAEDRLQKTPLSYWLVASVGAVTGKIEEFEARLPSIILGVASAMIILYYVGGWLGFRIGAMSAIAWSTCLGYTRYCHNARPEMALTFFVTLCFLSFYAALNSKSRKSQIIQMLIFWASFGLANLAKGPAPLPLVCVPLFVYFVAFNKWKTIPKLLPITGPLILIAISAPWPLAVAYNFDWDMTLWKHEFVDRFFGSYASGDKPIYYYLPRILQFTAPWSAFAVAALLAPFYKIWGEKRREMMYMWIWFVAGLIFITINGGKRQHYMLPMLPGLAILIGIVMEDMIFTQKAYTAKFARDFFEKHVIFFLAAAIGLPVYFARADKTLLPGAIITSVTFLIMIAITSILFKKQKKYLATAAVMAGFCVMFVPLYTFFINPMDYNRYSRTFSQRLAEIVPADGELIAFEYVSDRSVQYFGRPIKNTSELDVVRDHYNTGGWVMATAGHLEKILAEEGFRQVYKKEKAERRKNDDAPGALFHKSAETIGTEP